MFGVDWGVDLISSSIQLKVDKCITQLEKREKFSSWAHISLGGNNMFNAVSCSQLCQLVATDFLELEAFANLLYDEPGQIVPKKGWHMEMDCHHWEILSSRLFIPSFCWIHPPLYYHKNQDYPSLKAIKQVRCEKKADDNRGIILISGYFDGVNILVPRKGVATYLENFEGFGIPLGAILNKENLYYDLYIRHQFNRSNDQISLSNYLCHWSFIKKAITYIYYTNKGEPYKINCGL